MISPVIIVHGGAKEIPEEEKPAHREGCKRAAEAGWAVLQGGGKAIDAVEAAIRVLEDDPTFNAGYGSDLNKDGEVQMDANIMEGSSLKAGAVGFIQGVWHPISVARQVFESESVILVGDGAHRFAEEQNAELCDKDALITEKARKKWEEESAGKENNTVGCVALDTDGHLAAGASTGGTGGNPRGRLGDTPMVGCGIYVDDRCGGCSNTGDGESIAKVVLAKAAVDMLDGELSPDEVAHRAMAILGSRTEGDGGCILIDRKGRIGWGHNSADIAVAYRNSEMSEALAFTRKSEEAQETWQKKSPHQQAKVL